MGDIGAYLTARRGGLVESVPQSLRSRMTWTRIVQSLRLAITRSPDLQVCSPESVHVALLEILSLGLDPSGTTGQAYLVPRKGVCTAVIGYQGRVELAYRSGQIARIACHIVHARDDHDHDLAAGTIRHRLCVEGDPGPPLYAYCVIILRSGEQILEIMTRSQYDHIVKQTRSGGNPAIKGWFEQMWRKSCLLRALKMAPKSLDILMALDDERSAAAPTLSLVEPERHVEAPARQISEVPEVPDVVAADPLPVASDIDMDGVP